VTGLYRILFYSGFGSDRFIQDSVLFRVGSERFIQDSVLFRVLNRTLNKTESSINLSEPNPE
jgi:hypothetical protein